MRKIQDVVDQLFVKTKLMCAGENVPEQFLSDVLISQLYNENCVETLARMKSNIIDCIITSPPYGTMRLYHGFTFPFEEIAQSIYRVLCEGGVLVWVVGDQTKDGTELCIPFEQALYFRQIGFCLHDTMIYRKLKYIPLHDRRYQQAFEYMFIFSKGPPKTFNPIMVACIGAGRPAHGKYYKSNKTDFPTTNDKARLYVNDQKVKSNVWDYAPGIIRGGTKGHPAAFSEQLVKDHLISWTNEYDVVYDPMTGSGTTGVMCKALNRHFLGSEISKKYCDLALNRMNTYL